MENKKIKGTNANKFKGPMNGSIGKMDRPVEKAKNFNRTLIRLIKYIGNYNVAIITVIVVIILSTVLAVMSPKILGNVTTELGTYLMQKSIYDKVQTSLESIPAVVRERIPQTATLQNLIDMKIIPEAMSSNIPNSAKGIQINVAPKINYDYIGKTVLKVLVLYVISALFLYISTRKMGYISQKITYKLRKQVDEKLDKLPLSFYDKYTHGEILSRVTNDIDNINTMFQQSFVQIIQSIFTILGTLIMMFSISFSLTLVAITVIPLTLFFVAIVVKKSQKYFIVNQKTLGELNGQIEETYSSDIVVKAFNMQDREVERLKELNDELYLSGWKSQFLSGIMMPVINTINNIGYVGTCILGAKLVINGSISIGDIQAFIQYTNRFSQPIAQTASMLNLVQGTVASAERVFEVLDEKEEIEDSENIKKLKKVNGHIVCENIRFSYKENESLIENFSLDVKSGQTVAIVGPTGAGKTTIVNLLMRFYELNGGDIKVDGVSINDIAKQDLRKMFSMVLQDTWLFNGTIRDNLRYAKQDASQEEIENAAKLAYAHHFIKALPGGYDFVLNEDATNISQGQKQLLTIARALLASAPMLILDEATSNVDTRTEQLIQKAMLKLISGRTSFVIAHRLSTIKNADIIIVMDKGKIVERGKHEELLRLEGKYAKLYNSQFEVETA